MGFSGLWVAASAGLVITRPSGVRRGGGDTKFSGLFVMVGSQSKCGMKKNLGWIHMFFFSPILLFTGPRLDSQVRGLALLYAAGVGKVVCLLGYKQQDLGNQGGLCSKVEDELDSCSQSVTGNHLIKQIEKQSVILHPPRVLPRIKVLIKDDQPWSSLPRISISTAVCQPCQMRILPWQDRGLHQEGELKCPLRPFFGVPSDSRGGQPAPIITAGQGHVKELNLGF